MAADVDFEAVAEMCEGHSGDDMTNICRDAAMNGMRNLIAGKTPDQIRHETLMPLLELVMHQDMCSSNSLHLLEALPSNMAIIAATRRTLRVGTVQPLLAYCCLSIHLDAT